MDVRFFLLTVLVPAAALGADGGAIPPADHTLDFTAGATLLLAALTAWLAWETRKTAHAASDSLALQSEPYLALTRLEMIPGWIPDPAAGQFLPAVHLRLILTNPGHVRVTYEIETATYSFLGVDSLPPRYLTVGGVVHPGAEATFTCAPVPMAHPVWQLGMSGTLSLRVNFWSSLARISHLETRLQFVLESLAPALEWRWYYLRPIVYT